MRKQFPQIIQSVSVQEQSVHIGTLPSADEARKYQESLPDFVDRTLAIAEKLQKADIEITKRGQIFRAIHSYSALLIPGRIEREEDRQYSGYGFDQRRDFEQTPRRLRQMKARSSWQRGSAANFFFACSMATESGRPCRNSA